MQGRKSDNICLASGMENLSSATRCPPKYTVKASSTVYWRANPDCKPPSGSGGRNSRDHLFQRDRLMPRLSANSRLVKNRIMIDPGLKMGLTRFGSHRNRMIG